ncbi:hypothetical protein LCGC14_1267300 [marine sediment metagenome]|uniref:Uncharacterized protein n=1 Tax=marine sediment metagenome TaxID=412755 RepID=A0A0F9L0Y2_9ZZZZ
MAVGKYLPEANPGPAEAVGATIKNLYEVEANAYTDTKDIKLSGIAEGADVTGSITPPTRSFYVWPQKVLLYTDIQYVDGYPTAKIDALGDYVAFSFIIPSDFGSLVAAKIKLWSVSNGTFDWTVTTAFAADGEDNLTHTDSDTANGQGLTDDKFVAIDLALALTDIVVGDNVGLTFTLDAETITRLHVIGLEISYTEA